MGGGGESTLVRKRNAREAEKATSRGELSDKKAGGMVISQLHYVVAKHCQGDERT